MTHPVELLDTTLRDGSYIIDFQFTAEDTALIASALESAGIRVIEVGHGLGLGAARAGKGDQASTDEAYLRAAADVLKQARFGVFFIPGVGTEDDLRLGADCGLHFVRIGTNITELDEAEPYIALAKKLGLTVSSNLMKSYAVPPAEFGARARQAADYGADVVCLVDSAGGMLPEDVKAYLAAAQERTDVRLGFHGHDNLCMAIANSLTAMEHGATIVDASLQGMGRSEGNAVTEVLAAMMQKRGLLPEADINALLDVGEAYIRPLLHQTGRSAIGVTTGRAKFHSSFLGRVTRAAVEAGIDVRELILRLGARDQINAPEELVQEIAAEIASESPRDPVRVDIAATGRAVPQDFLGQVRERALELREKSRKYAQDSVFNVVVSPHQLTCVSPFVDTNYGCAMSNIMLAEPDRLAEVLETIDGLVDYVLLDPGGRPAPTEALQSTVLLTYLDHEMWARTTCAQITFLLGGQLHGRRLAITGSPPLVLRAAGDFVEAGAHVALDSDAAPDASIPGAERMPLDEAVRSAEAVISLSPRQPAITADHVAEMEHAILLYDGGIGSLHPEAVPAAEERGIRVVRVDMRPSLAATALERIAMKRLVDTHMGRANWNGVDVVAGGLIGREGDVIVDSISRPTRVIGIADGKGAIVRPDPADERVHRARQAIASHALARTKPGNG